MRIDVHALFDTFLKKDAGDCVSLDMGAAYIKALYTSASRPQQIFVCRHTETALDEIAGWMEKERIISKPVRLAVKGPDTLVRYIPFPKVDKKNLKEVMGYEISKYLPFSRDEIYYDTCIVDEAYSASEFFILLAAARKNFLDPIIKQCSERKIKIAQISLASIVLVNLFSRANDTAMNTALVDIGYSSTILNILKKGVPCLSREIKVSSGDFISRTAKIKSISSQDAEKFVTDGQKVSREEINEAISVVEDVVLELSEEIKNSLDYFEVNWGQRINMLYVCGGLSNIKGIDKIMFNSLGIETKIWDVLAGFDVAQTESFAPYQQVAAVALGLGL